METRIIQVFYDSLGYPFKDKERTVRYPISGNAFRGASNTTEIRFYIDRIGGNLATWVANGVLPNGVPGHQVLNSTYDEELEENYVTFTLSAFFTQYKGDLTISLAGYNGGLDYEEISAGVYRINGTPVIQTTGVIKLNIAYSTGLIDEQEDQFTFNDFFNLLSTKLTTKDGFVVVPSKSYADTNVENYANGQYVYSELEESFYKKESGSFVLKYDLNAYRDRVGLIKRSGAFSGSSGLSEAQLGEAKKQFCFMLYTAVNPREMYMKVSGVASGETESTIKFVKIDNDVSVDNDSKVAHYHYKTFTFNGSGQLTNQTNRTVDHYTEYGADQTFVDFLSTQTISGTKTFTLPPKSSQNASNDEDLVRKLQLDNVDDKVDQEVIDRGNADNTLDGKIAIINGKIPSEASSSNKLVDEERMNSTINSMAAFFRGNFDNYATPQESGNTTLMGVAWQTEHKNQPYFVSNNDYAYVNDDETHDHEAWRYIYVEGTGWQPQFRVNEAPLTASQLAALNSGITSTLVAQITKNQNNISSNTYDSTQTYNENDVVIYDGILYQCQEDNVTGTWDSTKWTSVSLLELYYNFTQSINYDLRKLPQYVDINIVVSDWDNYECEKSSGVTDLTNDDIVLCLPNGYMNDAYIRAYDIKLVAFDNTTGVATFECTTTPSETINLTLQILRK